MKFFDIENKYKILLVFFILKICFIHIDMAEAKSWQELKGDHFIVFFIGEDKFAGEVLDNAEVYYKRIAFKLGYDRYSDFWTWDKRVKIYIYRDHNAYLKFSGQPDWSHGMADYTNKQILSYIWGKNFIESLLPHEIAHLVFRDFVGFKGEVPLWLDEGVAQWAEKENKEKIKLMERRYYKEGMFFTLEDMMRLNINLLSKKGGVHIRATLTRSGDPGILFLSTKNLITTYYMEAVSLVNFMINRYGTKRFTDFCRELRDGKNINEALKSTYSVNVSNIKQLETEWRGYLEKELIVNNEN